MLLLKYENYSRGWEVGKMYISICLNCGTSLDVHDDEYCVVYGRGTEQKDDEWLVRDEED